MTAPPVAREQGAPDPSANAIDRRPVNWRHRLEYGALRAATGLFGQLSFERASNLGAAIGRLGYAPLGVRKDVVERQIAAAFPDWSAERVRATAVGAYENLGRTTIEAAILHRYDRSEILAMVDETRGWDVVERAVAKGRGVVFVTGHIGNWELAGSYVAARGVKLEAVVRQMENPLFDAYLSRARRRIGMEVVRDADAVRRVPRVLRAGGAAVMLFDQGAVGLASTWVPFFGRWAKTPRGPAVFAKRFGAPVIFGALLRNPNGRFTLEFEEVPVPDSGDIEADVDAIVREYSATLERFVRRAPEQYFWHHRRWKHQRPDTPAHLGDPLQ
jgi:KDO2-lipid IV(A) lauroyltransferase